jgi:hypothetical protein
MGHGRIANPSNSVWNNNINPCFNWSYAMIEKFFYPHFKRQKQELPKVIESLQGLAKARQLTPSVVMVLNRATHELRNELTIVVAVIDLNEFKGDSRINP